MATLSLCLISNDSAENMAQVLDSVRGHADEVVIADTGMDSTARNVCVQYGANVFQFDKDSHPDAFFFDSSEENAKWGAPGAYSDQWALGDFAAARNHSFQNATCDYVAWIDADDVLEQPEQLRGVVADMDSRGLGFGFLAYNYAQDHLGRVYYRQWRERVFRRGTAKWHNPVHEVLMPTVALGPPGRYEAPVYSHKRKAERKGIAHRNYKILLRQAWQLKNAHPEQPLDPRILFYLGQEARFVEPQRAVGFYEEYLQHSGWPEERAAAHVAIGNLLEYGVLGLQQAPAYAQADREYAIAAAEMPDNPDGLLGLARIAYLRGRHQDCVNYTERAFGIGNTDSMLGANPMDRTYRPHIFYNHALAKLGRLEEAIKSCEAGLAVMPDDPGVPGGAPGMLKHNIEIYRAEMKKRDEEAAKVQPVDEKKPMVVFDKNEDVDAPPAHGIPRDAQIIWAMQLWKQVVASGDYDKARRFLEALPSTVTADPVVARMFESTSRRGKRVDRIGDNTTLGGGYDVVFYVGPGPEPWDPNTPSIKGLGGSETAVIEIARELAKLGNRCVVYAEAVGVFDGVDYRHHSSFTGARCDVFIASRTPWASEMFGPIDARLKLLWVHDIHCGPASPQAERWLYGFDRIMCLSNWHKEFFLSQYPTVHADTVVVARNGIDAARFSGPLPVKQNILAFTSSPNRGLLTLLSYMPAIRRRVPDAIVHGAYGLDTWESFARQRNDPNEIAEVERYKQAIASAERDGILKWHGKVNQQKVAEIFKSAKVHGYAASTPQPFPETYCISALEAQAAGAVVIGTKFAGLPETVRNGFLVEPGPQYGQHWIEHCIHMLTDERTRSEIADKARPWALTQTWAALAVGWSEMFGQTMRELEANPIPLWRAA